MRKIWIAVSRLLCLYSYCYLLIVVTRFVRKVRCEYFSITMTFLMENCYLFNWIGNLFALILNAGIFICLLRLKTLFLSSCHFFCSSPHRPTWLHTKNRFSYLIFSTTKLTQSQLFNEFDSIPLLRVGSLTMSTLFILTNCMACNLNLLLCFCYKSERENSSPFFSSSSAWSNIVFVSFFLRFLVGLVRWLVGWIWTETWQTRKGFVFHPF